MKYFNECQTLDEAKNLFKRLCFKLHPDTSGYNSQADFVQMNAEFKKVADVLKFRTGKEEDRNFNAGKFYDMVKKFDGLEDIKINFIGSFIWLEDVKPGAMYQQREAIKGIHFEGYNFARWAGKKKSWYYSPQDYKQNSSAKKSIEELKSTYGGATFKTKQSIRITA